MEEQDDIEYDFGFTHPLLLPPVTSKIMEYLSIRDLVRCRVVCHQFNRGACVILRQRKTIKFRMKLEDVQEYTTIMDRSTDFPYTRYELEFLEMNDPHVEHFLHVCGRTISSLQLNYCKISTVNIAQILNFTPSLKSFWINCDPVDETGSIFSRLSHPNLPIKSLSLVGEYSQNVQLISDMLTAAATNIESLRFRCYDLTTETSPFELMCFDVFCNLPKGDTPFNNNNNNNNHQVSCFKKLKKFQMHYRLDNQQICSLTQMQLNLSHLHLNLNLNCDGNMMVSPQSLYNLLQGLQYTLTTLELDFGVGYGSQEKLYQFPHLQKLSRLNLNQFKGSSLSLLISRCPCLKHLSLINCCNSDARYTSSFFDFQSGYEPLESLVLSTFIDQPDVIKQISFVFPNLSSLEVRLTNEGLRKVFETMPNLQELTLSAEKINDEGLTGIDELGLNFLALELEDDDELFEDGPKPPKSTKLRRFPFIGQLEQLRVIKIDDATNLSDSTIIHGLIYCKNLTSISLQNSQITDISLRAIAERLTRLRKFETLSPNSILTIQGKAYIRENLPLCDFILGHQDLQQIYFPKKFTSQMEMFLDLFSN